MCTHADVARRCRREGPRLGFYSWPGLALCASLACGGSSSPRAGDVDAGDSGGVGGQSDAGPEPIIQLSCEEASGERLRVVVRQHGDGSSEFVRLHDTEFAETCRFAIASDGPLRCLPAVDGSPFAEGAIRYTDELCTAPIGQLTEVAGVPAPTHMRTLAASADACAAQVSLFFELGDKLTIPPDTVIFQKDGETCTGAAAPATDFFALGEELPPTAFVEGSESFADTGRISMAQVDGADGSRSCGALGPFRDRDLGDRPCALELSEDGSTRCLPEEVAPTSAFSDALCAEPIEVALVDEVCNPDATYGTEPADAECQLRRRVRALGEPLVAPVFQLAGEVCAEIAPGPVPREIGASLSPFSFAELAQRTDGPSGGDRLQRVDLASEDGLRVPAGRWIDTELEQACAFRRAVDDTDRCLPVDSPLELTARAISLFTDAACTAAVVVGDRDPSCADGEPRFVLEAAGGGRTRVYQAGAARPGPFYEVDAAAVCVEVAAGRVFYELGAEVLAETFVGGADMVE